ncbi:CAP domain-containing protein [Flavobacterium sp.]|uniref:CAP domain-containing protein n=1 Tax=Flavobacterium sp. TaxID=239 RepID=UPI00261E3523|nr:CAP domain-containing protein [Flavobacterium sp.]
MKRYLFLFALLLFLGSFQKDSEAIIDKSEAQKAFVLLNEIRANPANYYKELKFSKNIKIQNKPLKWNETLAKVAEAKALDMANRNYFDHVDPEGFGINYHINKNGYTLNPDWLKLKSRNSFESIIAEADNGTDAIKKLIIDTGIPSFGHRKHLLGMEEWNGSLVDIGIGFARKESGSTYTTYVSIIIAKHDWEK